MGRGLERDLSISDINQLVEAGLPEEVAVKVGLNGGIPTRGRGRYSIPRAIETAQIRKHREAVSGRKSPRKR